MSLFMNGLIPRSHWPRDIYAVNANKDGAIKTNLPNQVYSGSCFAF